MALPFTKNFTFAELTITSHDDLQLLNSDGALHHVDNLFNVMCVLEFIRSIYKMPILVTSGFRCEHLNIRVKGNPKSKHLVGRAADICPSVPLNSPLFPKYMQQLSLAVHCAKDMHMVGYYEVHSNYIHIQLP